MKIGVFDSGIGGITVLAALKTRFPDVQFVYFGDTAHVPYGPKSSTQIKKLSTDCALQLKLKQIDLLVVACNTASSHALTAIQEVMNPVPVIGVVEPGVDAVVKIYPSLKQASQTPPPVLVLATRATVQSHAYQNAFREKLTTTVIEQACPLLVPMIEEGWTDHSILHQTISEYIRPYLEPHPPGIALLGCTHYPWIHSAFQKALPGWTVVDSAHAVADTLEKLPSISPNLKQSSVKKPVEWIFTDPESVPAFAKRFADMN